MRAGELRHRVEIQSNTETVDDHNAPQPGWSAEITVSGSIQHLSGRELVAAQQVHSEATYEIKVRYIPTLTVLPSMRVKFGTRYFWILDVDNVDERNRELILACKEVKEDYDDS